MKNRVRLTMILAVSFLLLPWPATAQEGVKVCSLLTRDEVASAGATVTSRGLMADEPVMLKKGSLPGIVTDVRMDQCTTEMAASYAAFPARWSVASTKEALDKKTWDKMNEALSEGEKKEPDPAQKAVNIEGVDCDTYSWLEKKGGKRIYTVNCTALKGKRIVSLEFAQADKAKLPSAKATKQLLDVMLKRL
jgi:hypothetical protein